MNIRSNISNPLRNVNMVDPFPLFLVFGLNFPRPSLLFIWYEVDAMDLIPLLYVHSSLPCSFPISPNICLDIVILKPFLHLLNFVVCLFIWLRKAVIAKDELQLLILYTTFVVLPPIIMLCIRQHWAWTDLGLQHLA